MKGSVVCPTLRHPSCSCDACQMNCNAHPFIDATTARITSTTSSSHLLRLDLT